MMEKEERLHLKKLNRAELTAYFTSAQLPKFRAEQVFQWMYQKGARQFSDMTNLPLDLRKKLDETAILHPLEVVSQQQSMDGTTKFLFKLHDGHRVEAVMIPDFFDDGVANRLTVCVSSQVGCVFGCAFCATGKMGYFRNLTCGEIVDQLVHINLFVLEKYGKRITNVVYMGMGEPLHNYANVIESAHIVCDKNSIALSPKRITISTVGLAKQIIQLGKEHQPFNLAISLHAPTDEKRNKIMPINASMDLAALKEALQFYFKQTEKPVTYEYLLFDGFNDSPEDARHLAGITRWIPSKVNIIMYNNVLGVSLQRAREDRLNVFMKALVKQKVTATVRRSRGDDIDAGCGQLAIREGQPKGKTIAKEAV